MKTRHSVNQLHEDYNSVFDTFEKGKSLFAEGLFFEGYSFIRESLNRSEIDDHDILRVLKGDASVIFTRQDFFDVVEHPSYSQLCAIQKIKDEYSQLIVVDNKHL